jgi:4-amino-4-deoxy-L-arabinose transferase-like glycosyltransferase
VGRQGLARVASSLENHGGGPLPPLIQVLSGGWPWLALWPVGISQAWRQRRERWGRWSLGLTALVTLMVLPLQTQLPWYSLLLWPPFALCCGPVLTALVEGTLAPRWRRGIAGLWLGLGVLVLAGVLLSPLLPALVALRPMAGLALPGGLGLLMAGWLLKGRRGAIRRRRAAALGLVLGWGLSLLLLFSTPLWNWELNERPSILPLLPLVSRDSRGGQLANVPLLVDGSIGKRPSLRWYAQDPLGRKRSRELTGTVLLVTRAASPEQSDLARRLGSERGQAMVCELNRQGAQGWTRWWCDLNG